MTRPADKPPEEQSKRFISLTSRGIALAFAGLFLIIIGWGLYPVYSWRWTAAETESILEGTAAELFSLDDKLTVASAMAITTGEKEWITRYYEHKPRRTRVVQDLLQMLPVASEGGPQYADLGEAEKALTQTEKQAFTLLRANQKEEALRLITSDEYKEQKAIFSNGVTKIYREAIGSQEVRYDAQRRMFRIAVVGFLALCVAVLLGWARATKAARQWKHTLAEQRARERKVVGRAVADGLRTAGIRYSVGAAGEAAVDGLAMVDLDLTYDYVNPALCRLHKCAAPEDMIGRNIVDFLAEDTFDKLKQLTQKVIAGEQAQSFEGMARANGQLVQIEMAPSLMSNEEGAPWAFLIIVRDVTKQKQAQEELRKSRDFYLSLFEGFPAPVWRSGIDGGHDYFNSTWFSLTGRTLAQELGDGWTEGIHPEDQQRCVEAYREAFHAREPFNTEFRLRRHDGQYRWVINCGRPFTDPDGGFAGYIGACYDITERRQMEEELEGKNRELESFVYTVSHDLRAPLVSMAGFARLLEEEFGKGFDPNSQEYLRRIHKNIDSMGDLLSDLLEFSRIGRVEEHLEDVPISEVVTKVLEEHTVLLKEAGAEVKVADHLPSVHGSRTRLSQVFSNLISNAVKFSREGVAPRVEIGWEPLEGAHRFFVKDNGIGIRERDREKVFTIFSRLKKKDVAGTGIGLAIIKRVVEECGGQVGVDSVEGEGSAFWFTLPSRQEPVLEEEREFEPAMSRA